MWRGTYWAHDRSPQTIRESMEHSECFGVFTKDGNKQIGFARVVTDCATVYYICDVVVDEAYRKRGAGKLLLDAIHTPARTDGQNGLLATRDAQEFYRPYGYKEGERFLMRRRRGGADGGETEKEAR